MRLGCLPALGLALLLYAHVAQAAEATAASGLSGAAFKEKLQKAIEAQQKG